MVEAWLCLGHGGCCDGGFVGLCSWLVWWWLWQLSNGFSCGRAVEVMVCGGVMKVVRCG